MSAVGVFQPVPVPDWLQMNGTHFDKPSADVRAERNVMTQRFEGKIAVITGGNSGIGLATARAFVAEGAKVVILGRSEATLKGAQDELGSGVLAIRADVSRVADISRAMEQIRASFGRIDVLFVNAGIAKFAPLENVTEEMFDETMNTNLKGAYFTVQKAIPLLSNGAAVVLNASISAHAGMPNTSVYAASKAGVLNLAKTLSADLLARGVRVNVISPGPVETPIFDRMILGRFVLANAVLSPLLLVRRRSAESRGLPEVGRRNERPARPRSRDNPSS